MWKSIVVFLVGGVLVAFGLHPEPIMHWLAIHTGTLNESGPYYGFWSGFGSDIGEVTILTGLGLAWRHHNCHVKGCPRLGKPVDGTPYVACPKHHPDHKGSKRAVLVEDIHKAFHRTAGK